MGGSKNGHDAQEEFIARRCPAQQRLQASGALDIGKEIKETIAQLERTSSGAFILSGVREIIGRLQ